MSCLVRTCSNSRANAPEKHFFSIPTPKKFRKRWCQSIGEEIEYLVKHNLVCEDHFDFEKDLENYMKVRFMNATPVLKKNALPNRHLGPVLEEVARLRALKRSTSSAAEGDGKRKTGDDVPLRDIHLNVPDTPSPRSVSKDESESRKDSNCCGTCQRVFASQRALAIHTSECILHVGFAELTRAAAVVKSNEKQKSTLQLPSREVSCITRLEPKYATPVPQRNKDPPSKGVIQEKVIDDESWMVVSLPKGYKCADAMFVMEAEGNCMLQQQIPVRTEESPQPSEQMPRATPSPGRSPERFQPPEEDFSSPWSPECLLPDLLETEEEVEVMEYKMCPKEPRLTSPSPKDLRTQSSELVQNKDPLPPWPFHLLPDALEVEEEKEQMEHKLVLEPRMMEGSFVYVNGQSWDDSMDGLEEITGDPLEASEVTIKKEPMNIDKDPLAVSEVKIKSEPMNIEKDPLAVSEVKIKNEAVNIEKDPHAVKMKEESVDILKDHVAVSGSEVNMMNESLNILKDPLAISEDEMENEPADIHKDTFAVSKREMQNEPADIQKDPLAISEDEMENEPVDIQKLKREVKEESFDDEVVVLSHTYSWTNQQQRLVDAQHAAEYLPMLL